MWCNLQTNLLCREANQPPRGVNTEGRPLYDLEAALRNLSAVPCVGRAEYFDEDVASFLPEFAAAGINFEYHQPVTENIGAPDFGLSLEQQLNNTRTAISESAWDKLHWFNHQDIELFDAVCRRLEGSE